MINFDCLLNVTEKQYEENQRLLNNEIIKIVEAPF